jgi:exonuclease III
MKIIARNYRELGNASTVRGLLELQKQESPDILFLSELKMDRKRMERFRWMLNIPNLMVKDCKGLSGGLAPFLE